jgi:hypothetical protein
MISGIFFLYRFLVRDPEKYCFSGYSALGKNPANGEPSIKTKGEKRKKNDVLP